MIFLFIQPCEQFNAQSWQKFLGQLGAKSMFLTLKMFFDHNMAFDDSM